MINPVEQTPETILDYNLGKKQKPTKTSVDARPTSNRLDTYISNNPQRNLKYAINYGDAKYVEPTTILWGAITLRDGYYSYTCNGHESIGDIKKKFAIPENAIFRLNKIKDDNYVPENGKEIAFDYKK